MRKPTFQEQQQFANELPLVMHRAGQLGLWRTMHKLHDAVRELGWELADAAPPQGEPQT